MKKVSSLAVTPFKRRESKKKDSKKKVSFSPVVTEDIEKTPKRQSVERDWQRIQRKPSEKQSKYTTSPRKIEKMRPRVVTISPEQEKTQKFINKYLKSFHSVKLKRAPLSITKKSVESSSYVGMSTIPPSKTLATL